MLLIGKTIDKWAIYTMAMLVIARGYVSFTLDQWIGFLGKILTGTPMINGKNPWFPPRSRDQGSARRQRRAL
jgi:hypothetical protein